MAYFYILSVCGASVSASSNFKITVSCPTDSNIAILKAKGIHAKGLFNINRCKICLLTMIHMKRKKNVQNS